MSTAQMMSRCPGAKAVGTARLAGYRFIINERGVATIERDDDATVYGVVWEITPAHEEILDRREGVAKGCYNRACMDLVLNDGSAITALVYQDPTTKVGLPREGYLPRILSGAAEHELPAEYREELGRWARPGSNADDRFLS